MLSVVVPSYRQRATICAELQRLHALLSALTPDHEIVLVIDGDTDGTAEELLRVPWFPELRVERFPENCGKGAALRHGLRAARGELVAFLDAGEDLDATEFRRFLAAMTLYDADIVIGSKRHTLSEVAYPPIRRLYSWTYQLLNRVLFRMKIRDTQVGMKLFRREVLAAVLPRLVVKAFAFDLELLVVAHRLGFTRIVEAPVRIRYGFRSSISWRAVFRTLWDTLAVFYRLRILHWYDVPQQLEAPPSAHPVPLRVAVPTTEESLVRSVREPAR
ncbi:MAG: dolichol-phosphate mannosyltransferase [Parcubacteria group bacterium Gr01-1014_106]|nr:MAG: dolichol-phosphate mannosyltransferase [Parcubacteria group bacterium Gr01-1014_106]